MEQRSSKTLERRLVRWSIVLAVAVTAFIAAGLIAINWLARSDLGRNWIEVQIEALSPAGQKVSIVGLNDNLLGSFTVEKIQVSDRDGVWLTAEDVSVGWHPYGLLQGKLNVRTIDFAKLKIERSP